MLQKVEPPRFPVPVVVPVGTVALGVLLGLLIGSGRGSALAWVGLVPVAVGAVLAWRFVRFEYGFYFFAFSTSLIGYKYQIGTSVFLHVELFVLLAMMGLWAGWMAFDSTERLNLDLPLIKPALICIATVIFSWVWSLLLTDPLVPVFAEYRLAQIVAAFLLIVMPAGLIFVAHKLPGRQSVVIFVTIFVTARLLVRVVRILDFSFNDLIISGDFGLNHTWPVAICLAMALFNGRLSMPLRLLIAIPGLLYFAFNMTNNIGWLSGWIPSVVAVSVLLMRKWRTMVLWLPALAVVGFVVGYEQFFEAVITANLNEGSGSRLQIWLTNMPNITNHPIFGTGPAGYTLYNRAYNRFFPGLSSHNNYVDLATQLGLVGFVAFGILFGRILLFARQVSQQTKTIAGFDHAFAEAVFAGWCAALVAMMLGDWVIPYVYNQTIAGFNYAIPSWMFVGALIVLARQKEVEESIR